MLSISVAARQMCKRASAKMIRHCFANERNHFRNQHSLCDGPPTEFMPTPISDACNTVCSKTDTSAAHPMHAAAGPPGVQEIARPCVKRIVGRSASGRSDVARVVIYDVTRHNPHTRMRRTSASCAKKWLTNGLNPAKQRAAVEMKDKLSKSK